MVAPSCAWCLNLTHATANKKNKTMKLQKINYQYDLVGDHVPLSGFPYWATVFMAVAIWLNSVFQVLNLYKEGASILLLALGMFIIFALTVFVWVAFQGMKPFGKEGKVSFIKIKNGELTSKLTRFGKARTMLLGQLEKVDLDEKRIILKEKGKDELYITLSKIQNSEKREEFVKVMNKLKK